MQGYTDTPIERLENDVMDVKVYVESLSEFILDCSTPMTIAIQGDWGSGKTSMMNMIKQALADKIVPVWFNTWQYSQFEMASYLSISLLSNFLEKIGAEEESQNFLRSIAKGAIGVAKTVAVVLTEQTAGGTIAGKLKENLSEIGKQDSAKALEELRDKIREAVSAKLKSSGKNRVVVFVDDLDRLAPEKAVELLEVLKVFMDVPNCVFVLAVDYAVVTQGLEKKFGVGVGHSKGRSFFDKIIQLPFAIPIAQYNISAYIQNLLSNMSIVCSEEEISTYREIVDCSIGCNPRSMKRLFNSFILLNTVASKKGMFNEANDIKAKDKQRILFASLCLQMAFQEIYEFMIKNKNELDADFFDGIKGFEKLKTDSAFEEIRKNIPIKEDLYYDRIADFMGLFYKILQLDDDLESLSDEELGNLKNILSFSAITSTGEKPLENKRSMFSVDKGNFDLPELEKRLRTTLARQTDLTPRLVNLFEILLSENRAFDREEIKQKLFARGIGSDIGRTGAYLSNLSQFLTKQSNPHLRQVMDFASEGRSGARKNSYLIQPKYRELIATLLDEWKQTYQTSQVSGGQNG